MNADKWDALIAWVCAIGLFVYFIFVVCGGLSNEYIY
jgi:hypothetical protein